MRVLFIGDILGRAGRTAVETHLPGLRDKLKLDFVVANGENAAGGFGITADIARQLFAMGIDCISGGNHTFDQRAIMPFLNDEPRILRPLNYPEGTPGRGIGKYTDARGRKLVVINAMGRVFMDAIDDPFAGVDRALGLNRLKKEADFILIDMHGEATSEKMAMGHFADGRASLVVGSHSHIPTADALIMAGGTAYQTDAGMCGDYDSVIGMVKEEPLRRFTKKIGKARFQAAKGEATLCGVFCESDDATGLAKRVEPVRIGGLLKETMPEG